MSMGQYSDFDSLLDEMDQVDQLDDHVQRLRRISVLLKVGAVLLLALILLLGGRGSGMLRGAAIAGIAALWTAEAFMLRRCRLETKLLRDILKGAAPAPDLRTATLQALYPGRETRLLQCFFAREVFGFYCPFLVLALVASAFMSGGTQEK